jgi:FkbM family methyltransferase
MGLRKMLRAWERRRLLASVPDLVAKSKSQLHQDLWVLAETGRKRNGIFVEVGAFDGIQHSNTYLLEKEFGWSGILVEPNPDCLASLRKHRSAAISAKAISSERRTMSFVSVREEPALSSLADHAWNDGHSTRRADSSVISVDAILLSDLLKEHGAIGHIDYLSLDTEGSEYDILSSFDFDQCEIDLISVEHNYTASEADIERLLRKASFKRVYRRVARFDAWYRRI